MSAVILRGDARHLPLPDESVDLIVTSPPSGTHAVEVLRALEASFKAFRDVWTPGSGTAAVSPNRQVRLRDKHLSRTQPQVRNVALSHGLDNDLIAFPEPSRSLGHRDHRLIGINFWQDESAALAGGVQTSNLDDIELLLTLDPQIWKQLLAHANSHGGVNSPAQQRPAPLRGWFSVVPVAAEQAVQKVDGLGRDLLHLNARHVDRLARITTNPHCVGAAVNPDVPVRIDNPRRIGEIGRNR
jgi:hypothetical protein